MAAARRLDSWQRQQLQQRIDEFNNCVEKKFEPRKSTSRDHDWAREKRREFFQMDEDVIPGHTSYLYEQNRFREDHEYVNSWKWADEHVTNLKDLQLAIEDRDSEIETLREDISEHYRTIDSKTEQANKLSKDLATATQKLNHTEQAYVDLRDIALKFGHHTDECQIVKMAFSGRSDENDEDECTCGWDKMLYSLTSERGREMIIADLEKDKQ